jgi:hypothetical protein
MQCIWGALHGVTPYSKNFSTFMNEFFCKITQLKGRVSTRKYLSYRL